MKVKCELERDKEFAAHICDAPPNKKLEDCQLNPPVPFGTDRLARNCYKTLPQKSEARMFPSCDVFQIDEHGRVVWKGFVESLMAARAAISKLMLVSASDYLIVDQSSGQRLVVPKSSSKPAKVGTI